MIRILAIDDKRDNLVVLKALLDESFPDAKLLMSDSGVNGLMLLEKESPDIVILDLIMPGMDGFEVLKRIRLIKDEPYIPVIILTAVGSAKDKRIRALELGADAFLTKPVDEAELIAQINAMLRIRENDELKRNESIRLARLVDIRTRELREEMNERKRTEQILRESEERFRMIFERAEMGIVLVSESMNYIKANPSFCEMTGYSEDELLKLSVADLTAKEDYPESKMMGEKLWKGLITNYSAEKRYIHKSGRTIWTSIAVNVVRNSQNEPQFFLTMINNITAKKMAEEKLAKEQVLLKTLIDNLPQTIYVKDLKKRKILANRADLDIIGKSENEVIGKTDMEVFPKSAALRYEQDDDLVMSTGKPIIDREEIILNCEGKKVWFLTSKIPLFDNHGNLSGLVGIGHDITARKNAEIELTNSLEKIRKMNADLQLAKEKAEESDRLKTAFLHNISHEIRTPLNAIIGFASVLTKENLPVNKRNEFAEIIFKSNDQLLSIISSIITLASLESGQEKCIMKETDINRVLVDVHEQFMITVRNEEISFTCHAGLPNARALIMTDQVKLMQILVNLVGNALKFTISGYVKFGYDLKGDILEFYVEDTGIGIPENMHETIFERFRQVDNSETRHFGGTGLGLSISRGYAQLLGGDITVNSSPGQGSKFILKIPYNPINKMTDQKNQTGFTTKDVGLKGIVLIAEDEHVNYLLLNEILSGYELEIYYAQNGLEAVDFCSGKISPDLILMDMKMPVMDGVEATHRIKRMKPNLPVIAVTAYTTELDRKRFYEAGCEDFIEKPFRSERLISVLTRHLPKH